MRVLITGATGFIGGWLARELVDAYPEVRLYGTSHRTTDTSLLPSGTVLLPVDLNDSGVLTPFLQEAAPEVVFHLAGSASGAGTDRAAIFDVNVRGTCNLLRILTERGNPCRVQLASSGYVYGPTKPNCPARETDPPSPAGTYAESKRAMEEAARPFADNGPLSLTITRSFNHTGPRQGIDFVIPAFARQIARIEKGLEPPVVQHGNLDALRDFLDVRDVVRAYRLLLLETVARPWQIVNVSSGVAVNVGSLLDRLISKATVPVSRRTDSLRMRPSDMPECIGDSSLLRSMTGWQPEIPLDKTLSDILDYWRAQEG